MKIKIAVKGSATYIVWAVCNSTQGTLLQYQYAVFWVMGIKVFKVKQGLVVFCGLTFKYHTHHAASVLRYSWRPRAASLHN
ncbi:GD24440 [Drosophila simulans]|uniref:GD24440 n=1 Tax=Drosophila simulans TaxID=7240 RepID=B4NUY4_DROSI|nr:GD24440 [Drosophila simulans]